MRFEKLIRVFKSNGYELRDMKSRQKNVVAFIQACDLHGVKIDKNIDKEEYSACIKELHEYSLRVAEENPEQSVQDRVIEQLDVEALFADFEKRDDGKGSPILKYTNPETKEVFTFGSIGDFSDHKRVTKALIDDGEQTLDNWVEVLKPFKSVLKIGALTEAKAVEVIWDSLFTGPKKIRTKKVDPESLPAVLDGFGKSSDYVIPFTRKHVTLDDLNPILSGFLGRMDNHKYFCAILASKLTGSSFAYTPYLFGEGGDGKTTFTRFLDKAVNGLTANLELGDSTFGLYNCTDKVFLYINDTSNKYVYHTEIVKKIAGTDSVKVNGKYQQPRDMVLPGMIIITSNQLPHASKEVWYQRRARIFKVSKMPGIVRESLMDTKTASNAMYSTVNEFWNYCIQCLEEVGNLETGYVNDLPNHKQSLASAEVAEDVYEDFLLDLGYTLDESLTISGHAFRSKISKKAQEQGKDKFFKDQFIAYLAQHKGVTKDDKVYVGIGIKQPVADGHTKFIGKSAA